MQVLTVYPGIVHKIQPMIPQMIMLIGLVSNVQLVIIAFKEPQYRFLVNLESLLRLPGQTRLVIVLYVLLDFIVFPEILPSILVPQAPIVQKHQVSQFCVLDISILLQLKQHQKPHVYHVHRVTSVIARELDGTIRCHAHQENIVQKPLKIQQIV